MTDTPIHDELQHFLDIDTGGGSRKAAAVDRAVPAPLPTHIQPRRHRA